MFKFLKKPKATPHLFSHIPKTAGTSFRNALEKTENCLLDYGYQNRHTSGVFKRNLYQKKDFHLLHNQLKTKSYDWLCGHFPIVKYSDFVDIRNIVTFVREPVSQVVSHYNHYISRHGGECSFADFITSHTLKDIQSHYLGSAPLTLLGFVGVTERYQESLDLLNRRLNLTVPSLSANQNKQATLHKQDLSQQQLELIKQYFKRDFVAYEQACLLLEQRLQHGNNWVHSHFEHTSDNMLFGCAYYAQSDDAVEVALYLDGQPCDTKLASEYYGGYTKYCFPRNRYIAVAFSLDNIQIKASQIVELRATKTQQVLFQAVGTESLKAKQ